jgi:hypothetical protein
VFFRAEIAVLALIPTIVPHFSNHFIAGETLKRLFSPQALRLSTAFSLQDLFLPGDVGAQEARSFVVRFFESPIVS